MHGGTARAIAARRACAARARFNFTLPTVANVEDEICGGAPVEDPTWYLVRLGVYSIYSKIRLYLVYIVYPTYIGLVCLTVEQGGLGLCSQLQQCGAWPSALRWFLQIWSSPSLSRTNIAVYIHRDSSPHRCFCGVGPPAAPALWTMRRAQSIPSLCRSCRAQQGARTPAPACAHADVGPSPAVMALFRPNRPLSRWGAQGLSPLASKIFSSEAKETATRGGYLATGDGFEARSAKLARLKKRITAHSSGPRRWTKEHD